MFRQCQGNFWENSKLTSVAWNFPAGKLQRNFRAFNYLKFQLRTLRQKEPHTTDVLNSPSLKKDKEKSTENINPWPSLIKFIFAKKYSKNIQSSISSQFQLLIIIIWSWTKIFLNFYFWNLFLYFLIMSGWDNKNPYVPFKYIF